MAQPPRFEHDGFWLTIGSPEVAPQLADYLSRNAQRFAPFTPPQPAEFFTQEGCSRRLEAAQRDFQAGCALRLLLHVKDSSDSSVVGDVEYTGIARGPFQACYLGYKIDPAYEGRGWMSAALRYSNSYIFENMKLHRIMANYMTTNARSGALLRKLGFVIEGYARDYLYLSGRWQDHVLTSLTSGAWTPDETR